MLGFVGFVFLSATLGRSRRQQILSVVLGAALLVVAWVAMPEENKDRLRTVWKPQAGPDNALESAHGRVEGLLAGLEMNSRYPVCGVGIGGFIPYRVREVDGVRLEAHSLIGQLLGETGLLGALTFLAMIGTTWYNCVLTKRVSNDCGQPLVSALASLTRACQISLLLLLFFGLFGHNLLRFTWLWIAAFALLCRAFSEQMRADSCEDRDRVVVAGDSSATG
jgi:O-antigen ligase